MPVMMTGSKPRPPVAFGDYEIGRSKKPANRKPTAAFKDGMKKGLEMEQQGDPGAYDPYMNSDIVATSSFTHNKTQKPFMSTSTRELGMNLYGEDSPGPGAYHPTPTFAEELETQRYLRSVVRGATSPTRGGKLAPLSP